MPANPASVRRIMERNLRQMRGYRRDTLFWKSDEGMKGWGANFCHMENKTMKQPPIVVGAMTCAVRQGLETNQRCS